MTRQRKLCVLSVLVLLTAALLNAPSAEAGRLPCQIQTDACPDGYLDCCCGSIQFCTTNWNDCQRACGDWP